LGKYDFGVECLDLCHKGDKSQVLPFAAGNLRGVVECVREIEIAVEAKGKT
jgi:hypothetical protein